MSPFERITLGDAPAIRAERIRRAQRIADQLLADLRPVEPVPDDTQELDDDEIEAIRAEFRREKEK